MDKNEYKREILYLQQALQQNPQIISSRTYANTKLYQLDQLLKKNNLYVLYMIEFKAKDCDRNGKSRAYTYIGFTSSLQERSSSHASSLYRQKANKFMMEAFSKTESLPTIKVLMITKDKDKILQAETEAIRKLEQLEFSGVVVKCLNISKREYEYQVDTSPFVDRDRED